MPLFTPDYIFKRITFITPEFLQNHGIKALILDVDNTLTAHGSQQLPEDIEKWLLLMKQSGIKLTISSNNTKKRVQPFADNIGLEFVYFSCKPLPFALAKARKRMGFKRSETALVGDQIFTDVLGAGLSGMKMLMVVPMAKDTKPTILFKRRLEKPFINRYYRKGGKLYE